MSSLAPPAEIPPQPPAKQTEQLESAVIRFCGDSGDGMQLVGTPVHQCLRGLRQRRQHLARLSRRNSRSRRHPRRRLGLPAPLFQPRHLHPGRQVDTLVVMNPAALKTNLADLKRGGNLIVNEDEFDTSNLDKAGYPGQSADRCESLVAATTSTRCR